MSLWILNAWATDNTGWCFADLSPMSPECDVSVLDPVKVSTAAPRPGLVTCAGVAIWTWKHDSRTLTVSVCVCGGRTMSWQSLTPYFTQTRLGMWSLSTQKLASGNGSDLSHFRLLTSLVHCTQVNCPGSLDKWTTASQSGVSDLVEKHLTTLST